MFGLAYLLYKLPIYLAVIKPGASCTLDHRVFFLIPPWWEYMNGAYDPLGQCTPTFAFPGDLFALGFAILDMLLRVAGFVAVVSIIIAGVQYITSVGNSEAVTNARKRIINALTGLAIALIATAVVSFVGRYLFIK